MKFSISNVFLCTIKTLPVFYFPNQNAGGRGVYYFLFWPIWQGLWYIYDWWTTTSCKNVETLSRKNNLSCFKSLLVTGLWDKIVTPLLPPIQSCSSKFWAWSCIASNFEKGWRGGHEHKIMDRPLKPKYGTVSQVLLQMVVANILWGINN